MRFTVGIVGNDGRNPHARCFEDFAKALAQSLKLLGHEVVPFGPNPGRIIMFGANNLVDNHGLIPQDAIVYNTEQLAAVKDPRFFLQNYIQYRQLTVWDYAESNFQSLKSLGIDHAVMCPVGYVPSMTTIPNLKDSERDIDVLFYGSVGNSRRREILDDLDKAGLKVVRLFGKYGEERDEYIARSRVVLNLHYYEHGVFEIFRVSHLLANRACVVTEAGGRDPGLETFAKRACVYAPREQIVESCRHLCSDARVREMFAEAGHEAFKEIDLVDNVGRALTATDARQAKTAEGAA